MYVPSNQFFVIVGDIQSNAVIEQLGLCYQDALFQPIEPLYLPEEPKQSSSRFKVEESSIELGHAHTSWHIPELLHADIPALEALSIVLGGGRSSRLYQQLREKQGLVHAIDAWTYNPGLPGLFGVSAVFDGNRYEDVIQGIDQQLKSVIEKGIQDEELHAPWELADISQTEWKTLGKNPIIFSRPDVLSGFPWGVGSRRLLHGPPAPRQSLRWGCWQSDRSAKRRSVEPVVQGRWPLR